jgi:hypothetical protein
MFKSIALPGESDIIPYKLKKNVILWFFIFTSKPSVLNSLSSDSNSVNRISEVGASLPYHAPL